MSHRHIRPDTSLRYGEITRAIIWAFYRVYDRLGYGFLEVIYKRAVAHELGKLGLGVRPEAPIEVWYDSLCLGHFRADLLVNDVVIIEIKAAETMPLSGRQQVLNYLRASDIEVGLVLNFGMRPQFLRVVQNHRREDASRA